jgi:hypothetical protein
MLHTYLIIFRGKMHILEMFCMFWHFSVHINPICTHLIIITSEMRNKMDCELTVGVRAAALVLLALAHAAGSPILGGHVGKPGITSTGVALGLNYLFI